MPVLYSILDKTPIKAENNVIHSVQRTNAAPVSMYLR